MRQNVIAMLFLSWGLALVLVEHAIFAQAPAFGTVEFVSSADEPPIAAAPPEAAQTSDTEPADWYPRHRQRYVQADVLFWDRVGTGCDQVLVSDINALPGEDTLLSTGNLDFGFQPGLRLTVGWHPDPCRDRGWCSAWELTYFGLFDWDAFGLLTAGANAAAVGDNNLAIPGVLGAISNNYYGADEIRATYEAELHNLEWNCIKSCCFDCRTQIDFLYGFRFLTLQEDFALIATDLQAGSGAYEISTENYLYGLQAGGRMRRSWARWALEVRGKAGLFVNAAQQHQQVDDYPIPLRAPTGGDGPSAAMLAELGVTFIRPITDVWSLRIGYDALGLGGVALAPNQLDSSYVPDSGTDLHADGWLFLHGAHAGLEASW
jgi:hypothetical protein